MEKKYCSAALFSLFLYLGTSYGHTGGFAGEPSVGNLSFRCDQLFPVLVGIEHPYFVTIQAKFLDQLSGRIRPQLRPQVTVKFDEVVPPESLSHKIIQTARSWTRHIRGQDHAQDRWTFRSHSQKANQIYQVADTIGFSSLSPNEVIYAIKKMEVRTIRASFVRRYLDDIDLADPSFLNRPENQIAWMRMVRAFAKEIDAPISGVEDRQVGMNSESTRLILDSLQKREKKFNFNHEVLSELVNITESVELRLALLERYSQR